VLYKFEDMVFVSDANSSAYQYPMIGESCWLGHLDQYQHHQHDQTGLIITEVRLGYSPSLIVLLML